MNKEDKLYGLLAFLLLIVSLILSSQLVGMVVRVILIVGSVVILTSLLAPSVLIKLQNIWKRTILGFSSRFPDEISKKKLASVVIGVIAFRLLIGLVVSYIVSKPHVEEISSGVVYSRIYKNGNWIHRASIDLTQAQPVIMGPRNGFFRHQPMTKTLLENDLKVVLAVNGDFFDEGGPQGFLSSGGRITAPNMDRAALEFISENGNLVGNICLFRFAMTANVTVGGQPFPIRRSYNTTYVPGDVGFYTADRGIASGIKYKNLIQARVLISGVDEKKLRWRGVLSEVVYNPKDNLRPNGNEIILVASNDPSVPLDLGVYAWAKRSWEKGAEMSAELAISPKPQRITISGGPEMLRFGQYIVNETGNPILTKRRSARTAVGISAEKTKLIIVAVEGPPKWATVSPRRILVSLMKLRLKEGIGAIGQNIGLSLRAAWLHFYCDVLGLSKLSRGMTVRELARHFIDEGMPAAINLDGGSSTEMVTLQEGEYQVKNRTMEGGEPEVVTVLGFIPRYNMPR